MYSIQLHLPYQTKNIPNRSRKLTKLSSESIKISNTLIPKSFGATNFRTKKCPKVCNAKNINFFALSESL